ncbi:hypothetical protein DMENIID0001_166040 [Sergentomyia squamirostris]
MGGGKYKALEARCKARRLENSENFEHRNASTSNYFATGTGSPDHSNILGTEGGLNAAAGTGTQGHSDNQGTAGGVSLASNAFLHQISNDFESTYLFQSASGRMIPRCFNETPVKTDESDFSESDDSDSEDDKHINVKKNLASIVTEENLTVQATGKILRLFNKLGYNVPLTKAALCQTSRTQINLRDVPRGQYVHFGIESFLLTFPGDSVLNLESIELDVNTDGLPIFKNSKSLWPILGHVHGLKDTSPFVISICIMVLESHLIDIYT